MRADGLSVGAPRVFLDGGAGTVEVARARAPPSCALVECYQQGARTRIRVVSPGYDPSWHVQFPKDIRTPGARYLVTELHPAARGGFYRTRGEIRRLR